MSSSIDPAVHGAQEKFWQCIEATRHLPPAFLAEIGTLFNQDAVEASAMIDALAKARDAVPDQPVWLKCEFLLDASLCLDDQTLERYRDKKSNIKEERYRTLIERKVLPPDVYATFIERARGLGLDFVVSVYDAAGLRLAIELEAAAVKIASSNVTHFPLIRAVAQSRVPMLIDTGGASLAEVDAAVRVARAAGAARIVVEHSPDGHPAPAENHNLSSLRTLADAFRLPVGLSDHWKDADMLIAAVALGARLVEKTISTDPERLEQDAVLAIGMDELGRTLERVRFAWRALGSSFRDPANRAGRISTSARMCLVAARDLGIGDRLSPETVTFAFPVKGIPVERFDEVQGWALRRPLSAGVPIGWADVCA